MDAQRGRVSRRQTLIGAAAAAVAAAGGAVLAACGKTTSAGTSAAVNGPLPVPQSGVVHLFFQANTQGSVQWNKTTQALFQEFVDKNFNNNPKYKGIWASCYPGGWGSASTQIAATIAGTGYSDVMHMCCADIPMLERQGFAMGLDDLMRRDNIPQSLWSSGHILADSYNGKLYGLPSYDGTLAIFYRQDILDQLGLPYPDASWDYKSAQQIWTQCTGVDQKTNRKRAGVSLYWSGPYEMIDWWLRGWGATEMNSSQDQATMATPEGAACLQYAQDLFKAGVAVNRGDQNTLLNGQAVFVQMHAALVVSVAQYLGSKYKWNVLPNPTWPKARTTFVTIDCYMMNAQTKHPDEAWTLMKWINGAEGDLSWPQFQIQINLVTPALKSLWDYWLTTIQQVAPPLQGKDLKWFADSAQQGYDYPTVFFKYQPNQAANLVDTWTNQILQNKISPELGLQQMQDQLNALQQAGKSEEAGLATSSQKFPTDGPAIASLPTGI